MMEAALRHQNNNCHGKAKDGTTQQCMERQKNPKPAKNIALKCLVWPVVLHGCEAWTQERRRKQTESSINVAV